MGKSFPPYFNAANEDLGAKIYQKGNLLELDR